MCSIWQPAKKERIVKPKDKDILIDIVELSYISLRFKVTQNSGNDMK